MPSWIPGYRLLEGPEQTGVPFRYRAVRETDGVAAWVRVDGFDASSNVSAMAVDAIYTATAHFDHPLLPLVLDCGFAGMHLPVHELMRLREGARLEARHLPVNEFLCEPLRSDGAGGLAGLEAEKEDEPFLPPANRSGARGGSPRAALAYRLAAQIHVILEGNLPEDSPFEDAGKTVALSALSALPFPPRPSADTDVPRELVRLGLSLLPEGRPDPEHFLTF